MSKTLTSLSTFSHRSQMPAGQSTTASIVPQNKGFMITCFIALGLIVGVLLAVIIYFAQLREGNTPSDTEITSMLVITGILFALAAIVWIWSGIRLFAHPEQIDAWQKKISAKANEPAGYWKSEELKHPELAQQRRDIAAAQKRREGEAALTKKKESLQLAETEHKAKYAPSTKTH